MNQKYASLVTQVDRRLLNIQCLPNRQRGYVLVTVMVLAFLVASVAFLMSHESAMNASVAAGELEHDELRYVTEAGLNHAAWQLAKEPTCDNYSNMSATQFGANSYSASITPNSGSPVTLSVIGVLANGATREISRDKIRKYQVNTTTVFQPGVAGIDTYIRDGANDSNNFGASQILKLNNQSAEEASLLKFNLSAIPAGSEIQSAALEMWLAGGDDLGNGVIDVHRVTQSWVEGNLDGQAPPAGAGATYNSYNGQTNWISPGGDYAAPPIDTLIIPSLSPGWFQWDLTSATKEWVATTKPNDGVLLRASAGIVDKIWFTSGDGNQAEQPKLTVTYACECGSTCAAGPAPGTKLLMIVNNPSSLTAQEDARKTLIQTWGYTVTTFDDSESLANINTAALANDVVYVSEEIDHAELADKLRNTPVGIVNEEQYLYQEFGFSNARSQKSRSQIDVIDNSHYITSVFPVGLLAVYTSDQFSSMIITPAAGVDTLALLNNSGPSWEPSLAAIDVGGALFGGGTAPARRVKLPWASIDVSALNADGQTITRRAIEWAAGAGESTALGSLAHWKLDETSGLVAVDSAGGHDGALQNGPTWSAGQVNGALNFDGTNDYVDVPHDDSLSLTEAMTFTAWINASSFGSSYQTILTKDAGGSTSNYYFGTWQDELVFGFFFGGFFREVFTSGLGLQSGTWHHLAASFENSSDTVRLFVDGIEVHSDVLGFSPSAIAADIWIGRSPDGERWRGLLDDVRIYDTVLSADDIATLAADNGAGSRLLFVVGNDSSLTAEEQEHIALTETWGYTVQLIDDGASQEGFNTALSNSDVVFTTNDIDANTLGSKIAGTTIGVVSSEDNLSDEFGFSAGIEWESGSQLSIDDNSHYITTPFSLGTLSVFASSESLARLDGTLAPDLQSLGSQNSEPMLVALNSGDTTYTGGVAAGRRVQLPWGGSGFDPNGLTADGLTLLQRALKWAAGEGDDGVSGGGGGGGGGSCNGDFFDAFNIESYGNNDGSIKWSTDWLEINESDGWDSGDERVDDNDSDFHLQVRDNDGGGEGVQREADLSGSGSAAFGFQYRRDGFDNASDYVMVQVSHDGGASWTELDRVVGPGTDKSYVQKKYDITKFASSKTRIRFLTSSGLGSGDELYIDNVLIQCTP